MKVFQSSIFRALCAIVVGALLVKYREQTVTWITIAIGVIFFVSGVISTVAYLSAKRQATKEGVEIYDAKGNRLTRPVPPFPIVGIGSIILGAWLALFPNSFVNGLMFVLAGMLILGALNLFSTWLPPRGSRRSVACGGCCPWPSSLWASRRS